MAKGQEVVCSSVIGCEEDEKGHAIHSRRRQSGIDVRAAIREGHKTRAAQSSEAQLGTVNARTDVAGGEKGTAFDFSKGEGIAKDRRDLTRE